jgi:glycosyltransferase involved in cell wall biosynthesis
MKLPLSLVVITRDEEKHLERCLKSVPFAQEIVILDSESKDRTREIALSFAARFIEQPFLGFGPQKRKAVEACSQDWVLCLDADEALSSELQEEILQLFAKGPPEVSAFRLPRLSFYMGRWIYHGGWYPDYQIRLFDRRKANWNTARLHEKVEVTGELSKLKSPIRHWVFDDLKDQVQTNNYYSTLGAEGLQARGKRFSIFKLVTKPIAKFLETYIWKRGFLDGLPGFIIAVGAAYSVFLKFSKLWELEQARPKS